METIASVSNSSQLLPSKAARKPGVQNAIAGGEASTSPLTRQIILEVPAQFDSQLVFRAEFRETFAITMPAGLNFHLCRRVAEYFNIARRVRPKIGAFGACRGFLKLLTARRLFFTVSDADEVLHYGWLTIGRCRHYHVGTRDVVIGPIWTSSSARGRGIATFALQMAMNELIRTGYRVFYIDTSHTNVPCLTVVNKCGFGPPLAAYVHRQRRLTSLLTKRIARAVKRRLIGSATLAIMHDIKQRGFCLHDLDALEVFGGTGELHTTDYAPLVRSLMVWEIQPRLEAKLRQNLPNARVKITDSLSEMRSTPERYGIVVMDNPIYVSETSLCEHFDFFPLVFRVFADRAVLVMNVIPQVSSRFRAEFPYVFNAYHLERRAQFYKSSTPDRIAIPDMLPAYAAFAREAGFQIDWHFSKKRGKSDLHFLVLGVSRIQP